VVIRPAAPVARCVNVDPTAERAGLRRRLRRRRANPPSTARRQCQDRSSSAGARTPIGKLSGALKNFQAVDLGGLAIKAALEKSGISGDQVDYVISGSRHPGGAGQITARRRSRVVSRWACRLTVNKVCLTGLDAIALADQRSGPGLIATADSRMLPRPSRRIRS
jgi:3-oxoacyl-[acyl-carrier-protein] synthase III